MGRPVRSQWSGTRSQPAPRGPVRPRPSLDQRLGPGTATRPGEPNRLLCQLLPPQHRARGAPPHPPPRGMRRKRGDGSEGEEGSVRKAEGGLTRAAAVTAQHRLGPARPGGGAPSAARRLFGGERAGTGREDPVSLRPSGSPQHGRPEPGAHGRGEGAGENCASARRRPAEKEGRRRDLRALRWEAVGSGRPRQGSKRGAGGRGGGNEGGSRLRRTPPCPSWSRRLSITCLPPVMSPSTPCLGHVSRHPAGET